VKYEPFRALRFAGGDLFEIEEQMPKEVELEIFANGDFVGRATITPSQTREFVAGHLRYLGLIADRSEISRLLVEGGRAEVYAGNYARFLAESAQRREARWAAYERFFATLSDDGVRVTVDGRTIIDNWTWHGPTRDTGTFDLSEDHAVEIVVEHFEINGYAAFELSISGRL